MITKHNPVLHGENLLRLLIPALAAAVLLVGGCASQPAETGQPTLSGTTSGAMTGNSRTGQSMRNANHEQTTLQATAYGQASAPVIREDAPLEYKVKKGDTLWDLAGYFLKDPWLWPEIWHDNPQVHNPHLIYPGDILYLVKGIGGQYHIGLRPGVTRLEPQVIKKPLKEAIPAIPLGAIKPFLNGPRVVPKEKLERAGYIVSLADDRILGQRGDTAYATGLGSNPRTLYEVVHPGDAYKDPKTGKTLGYKVTPTARVRTVKAPHDGQAATLKLTQSYLETAVGDRLLPLPEESLRSGYSPHAPEQKVKGQIIAAFHNPMVIGKYQIVALDLGTSDGVDSGTVLGIYRPVRKVADPYHKDSGEKVLLPRAKTGLLMVFKSNKHLSHALVMRSTREIHVGNTVMNPGSGNR